MYNIAYAADYSPSIGIIGRVNDQIINPLILLLLALAVIVFIWGIIEFIANTENEEKRSNGKSHMIWGIVGIFIMVSVFGIMKLICDTVGC